jgi:predicted permease
LVALVLPRHDRDAALADLDELYAIRADSDGKRRALAWYLRQGITFPFMAVRAQARATMVGTGSAIRNWLTTGLAYDARHTIRALRRSPGFSLVALGVLGLGMTGAITVFTLAYGILLRPLPYADAGRIVAMFTTDAGERDRSPTAPANVIDWRRDNHTVDFLTAAHPWSVTMMVDEPRRLAGLRATWSLFDLLQASPLLGRTWHEADSLQGDDRVVVLSHALWIREFGADSAVVGRTIPLNGDPHLVLGVMPADFGFPPFWASDAEFWAPLVLAPDASRRAQFLRVFARMRPGVTVDQVQEDFGAMHARLSLAFPDDLAGLDVLVEPLREPVVGPVRPILMGLLGATVLLLLVAVANVANLLLGRALASQRERAVRSALGAPRGRLILHELGQSTVLTVLAGILGLLTAAVVIRSMAATDMLGLPRSGEIGVDGLVVLVTMVASLVIGVACGGLSAMLRVSGAEVLRAGHGARNRSAGRMRDALVVAEVALAVVLLVGAALTMRSMIGQAGIDPGMTSSGVLTMTLDMGGTSMFPPGQETAIASDAADGTERQLAFFRETVRRVEALPGVMSVGLTSHLPLAGDAWSTAVSRADRAVPPAEERLTAVTRNISPGYPSALGLRVRAGRSFDDWGWDAPDVVMVNETLAARVWPGELAVGRTLRLGSDLDDPVATVIGVVTDVKQSALTGDVRPEFYRPYGQNHFPWNRQVSLAVRTAGPPAALARDVRAVLREVEPLAPVTDIRSMDDVLAEELFASRVAAALVGVLATFAILVSGFGLFGVVSFLVTQRRREFGVRMALGSAPGSVSRLVLWRGGLLVSLGLVIGLSVSALLTGWVADLLYQVPARDLGTFAGTAAVLGAIGLLAAWLPARRAARTDPSLLLRQE